MTDIQRRQLVQSHDRCVLCVMCMCKHLPTQSFTMEVIVHVEQQTSFKCPTCVFVALFHSIYTSFMPMIQISPSSAESMDVAQLPRVFLLSISTFYKKHRDAGIIQSRVSNNSLTAGTVVIPVESTIWLRTASAGRLSVLSTKWDY